MKRTDEQKREILSRVEAFRAQGFTLKEACKKSNIWMSAYYKWQGQRPEAHTVEVVEHTVKPKPRGPYIRRPSVDQVALLIVPTSKLSDIVRQIYE